MFPSGSYASNVSRLFRDKCKIPNVVGCIDGSHITIIRPVKDSEDYYTGRKSKHTLNC